MNQTDTSIVASDLVHSVDLTLMGGRALLTTARPPFCHELTPTAAEFLQIVLNSGPAKLLFFWRDELTYCRRPPPFLAVISSRRRFGFAYAPIKLKTPDLDAIFMRFPKLPVLLAGTEIMASEAVYAEIMCRRGES